VALQPNSAVTRLPNTLQRVFKKYKDFEQAALAATELETVALVAQ
jgi:hypothetical protein